MPPPFRGDRLTKRAASGSAALRNPSQRSIACLKRMSPLLAFKLIALNRVLRSILVVEGIRISPRGRRCNSGDRKGGARGEETELVPYASKRIQRGEYIASGVPMAAWCDRRLRQSYLRQLRALFCFSLIKGVDEGWALS